MATKKEKPFKSLLDPVETIYTKPGSQIEDVWAMRLAENGEEEFYIEGQTNVYEKIQTFKDDSIIENIVAKVIQTGDTSILNQRKGEFLDLTEVPANIFEAQQKITQAEKTFMELPIEIRNEYNNNFNEYLKDVGSEHWSITVGLKEKPAENIEEKGAANEQGDN